MRTLLLCLALVVLGGPAALAQDAEMTFRLETAANCKRNCTAVIHAYGRIAEDSYARFQQVASRARRGTSVYLSSRGGSLLGGVLLGLALRDHRSVVMVPKGATCASACAYAMLGGVVRQAGGRVGVHRFYAVHALSGQRSVAYERQVGAETTALLRDYVSSMGANPSLVSLAGRVDPSTIRFLSPSELRQYRVVTGSPRPAKKFAQAARKGRTRR